MQKAKIRFHNSKGHSSDLDGAVVDLALVSLSLLELPHGLHEIFLDAVVTVVADGKHASLSGDVAEVCAVEAVAELDDSFVVEFLLLGDGFGVNLENLQSALFVGQWNFDFAIDSTRSHKRGVERVGSIGSHDDLCFAEVVEAVHLVE